MIGSRSGPQPPLPRSTRLKEEYQLIAKNAAQQQYAKIQDWVDHVGISRTTIWRFLNRKPISLEPFDQLCDCIGLDWRDVGEAVEDISTSASTKRSSSSIDIAAIRQSVYSTIENTCGIIQLFGRPIPISRYVELSVFRLDELLVRRYESPELLGNDFALDNYNRDLGAIRNLPRISGFQAVKDYQFMLVYGSPGSGKTSYLKWLATQCNEGKLYPELVPIFLLARNFSLYQNHFDLTVCIADFLSQCGVSGADQVTIQLLKSGKIILFIDGLDELPEDLSRLFCRHIARVADGYYNCHFVFSCRLPLILPFPRFQNVLVSGFDSRQRQAFAKAWFTSESENSTLLNSFLLNLKKHRTLGELARTPLLIELLCRVFQRHREFPPTRADLYKLGIEDLLYKEPDLSESRLSQHINRDDVWRFLRKVAADFFMQDEPLVLFARRDVLHRIEEMFSPIVQKKLDIASATRILERIELAYGLLITQSANFCAFSHLAFQEYFTADYLVRSGQHEMVLDRVTDPKWRFVIELVAELLPQRDQDTFFTRFKQALDNLILNNQKFCDFIQWVDSIAGQVLDTIEVDLPHKRTLLRAWYFAFTLKDVYVASNPGKISSLFVLPDFDMATSTIASSTLNMHIQFYQAFHATKTDRYQVFERSISEIRESIRQNLAEDPDVILRLLNQIDGWSTVIQAQKTQSNHPVLWWESYRAYWRERICALMETLHGLRGDWQFTEEEEQLLFRYYSASRLLSICTVRAVQRLSQIHRQNVADSLLSVSPKLPSMNDEFVGY
ncbi:MAG: NACHT domain-containing protein [Cyanobacteria bacterium P01_E01_bin.6]